MDMPRQVLFIQGAGEGTHDEWDDKLVDSLRAELGPGLEVRYPQMPDEDDPSAATWVPAIRGAIAALEDGAVVVGHSIGGTILVHTLENEPPGLRFGAIVLLAAPFVGTGGWPGDGFELPDDLGARLPPGVPVHVSTGSTTRRSHLPTRTCTPVPSRERRCTCCPDEITNWATTWPTSRA